MDTNENKYLNKLVEELDWFKGNYNVESKVLTLIRQKEFILIRHYYLLLPALVFLLTLFEINFEPINWLVIFPLTIIFPLVLGYILYNKKEAITINPQNIQYVSYYKNLNLGRKRIPMDSDTRLEFESFTFGENSSIYSLKFRHKHKSISLYDTEQFPDEINMSKHARLIVKIAKLFGKTLKVYIDETEVENLNELVYKLEEMKAKTRMELMG